MYFVLPMLKVAYSVCCCEDIISPNKVHGGMRRSITFALVPFQSVNRAQDV